MPAPIRGRFSYTKLMFIIAGPILALAQTAQGQRPAKAIPINIDSVTSQEFRDYLRTLRFVPDTEAGDHQALLVGHYPDSAQFGPLATILPESRSNVTSVAMLARGRVIARVTHANADSYPRLGLLPHAVTYWWVQYNERTDSGRSVLIAVDADTNIVRRTDRKLSLVRRHVVYRGSEPTARFVWTVVGEELWGNCPWGCCRMKVDSL